MASRFDHWPTRHSRDRDMAQEHCVESVTDDGYTVSLSIADAPVKPSRRSVRQVSVVLLRDGRVVEGADVSVGFHPLHAKAPEVSAYGQLLLTPHHHHAYDCPGQFDGSIALHPGAYRVDVTIDNAARAGFVLEM
jgi:hypothetical protein